MKDVIERTAQDLINLSTWLDGQKSVWKNDKRLTEQYKRQKLSELDSQARQMLADKLAALWGQHDLARGLQGGLVWAMLKDAETRLRQAREAYVDPLDPQRLANEYRRVPALLERFSTVQEFEAFYENATAYECRALQDVVTENDLRRRFPGEPGVGHLIQRLRRDADAARRSPELAEAEQAFEAAHNLAAGVYQASRQAAAALGVGGFMSEAARVLGQVRVESRFENLDQPDARIVYRVAQKPPLVEVKNSETV